MEISRTEQAYQMIQSKAEDNTTAQSLSGIFGWPITIAADIVVIPLIYVPLWDKIRDLYGRSHIEQDTTTKIIMGIVNEIFVDIALDKIMGNIPILGIYFNAICAKTMTWRLGILFSMLAARGDTIDAEIVKESMILIRRVFPQGEMFKFATPSREAFIKLIEGVSDISQKDYNTKIMGMLEHLDSF